MPEKEHPQKELFAADSDETKAQAIVDDVLGEGVVDYHRLPKNVGVMGVMKVFAHILFWYTELVKVTFKNLLIRLKQIALIH